MSKRYPGGLITKTPVVPTTSAASGVWTLDQAITYIQAGTWPVVIGGPYWIGLFGGSFTSGYGVAVDSSGNMYACGIKTASPDSGELVKYNSSGVLQWQKNLEDSGGAYTYFSGVAVDSSSNVYVTGYSLTNVNLIVAKYNSLGTLQWQRQLGGSGSDQGSGISVDSSGNVYVFGYAVISSTFDFLIAKYNSSGVIQWQRSLGGSGSQYGYGIAVDSSGNSYVTGSVDSNSFDIQVAKYDTSGTLQWQRRLSSASNQDLAAGITVDSSGNAYVVGYSEAFGGFRTIVAKYNSSGSIQWQRQFGGGGSAVLGYGIAVDSSSNVYVTGPITGDGCYIVKYNSSGVIQWQRKITSANSNTGRAITVDLSGNIYLNGVSNGTGQDTFLIAKLPSDGSLTGTYTVGGIAYTYSASTLTDAISTLTDAATSLTSATSTLTDAASTLTDTATSLTSSVTNL